ncbi:MAG TPA: PorV/PorQ family protein [Rhodothermales bacterium]|nr:PorV/PorQ family protein [Rhodothermales bacterium]
MRWYTTIALLALMLLATPFAYGQDDGSQDPGFQNPDVTKSAQTGFKFLSLSLDPRAAAMGGAVTAMDMEGSASMFYNPAGMANLQGTTDLAFMRTQFIAEINYNAGSIAFSPSHGQYGVFGISVAAVDYGTFEGTVRNDVGSAGDYIETGNYSPTALAVGLGYARALSDRFAIGGNVKYAYQDLGSFAVDRDESGGLVSKSYSKGTPAFDFGVLYKTGFRSLNFAMSVRNFSRELKYEEESFELPLTFRVGVSMDLMDLTSMNSNMHSLRVAVDAERPRDFAEQLRIGGEYLFMNTLALRAGYGFPTDTEGVSLGVGLQQNVGGFGFAFNYAYTTYGEFFGNVHRLGVQLSL